MCLDEVFTLLNLIAHKVRDRAISCKSIIDGYLKENAVLWLHSGCPKLLWIHLTKTLVALNGVLGVVLILLCLKSKFFIGIDVFTVLFTLWLNLIQRRLSNVYITCVNHWLHITIEEGKQKNSNVRAVNIGIGHDDNLVITSLLNIKLISNARTNSGNQRSNSVRRKCAVSLYALNVQNLSAKWKNCLDRTVTCHLCRTTCGVTLDDEELSHLCIANRAVCKLSRKSS